MKFFAACLLAATTTASAQQISGPVLGYLFDSQRNIRPIQGLPQASTLGPPLPLVESIHGVWNTARSGSLLVIMGEQKRAGLLNAATLQTDWLEGVSSVSMAAVSPLGELAVLLNPVSAQLHLVDLQSRRVLKNMWLSFEPVQLAVSDDGFSIAATDSGGRVHLMAQDGTPVFSLSGAFSDPRFDPRSGAISAVEAGSRWKLTSSKRMAREASSAEKACGKGQLSLLRGDVYLCSSEQTKVIWSGDEPGTRILAMDKARQ